MLFFRWGEPRKGRTQLTLPPIQNYLKTVWHGVSFPPNASSDDLALQAV